MSNNNSSVVEADKNGQSDLTNVNDGGKGEIKRLRAQIDRVMADLATVDSKYAPPKRKRDNEDKHSKSETPRSSLKYGTAKYSDPLKTVYFPTTTNY